MRKENEATIVVDTGRFLDGASPQDQARCRTAFAALALMGYDAVGVSAYDFRFGQQYLLDLVKETKVPIVSCNLQVAKTKKLLFAPFVIKQAGKLRVAVIGVSSPEDNSFPQVMIGGQPQPRPKPYQKELEGLVFLDPKQALKDTLKQLRGKADLIVLLSGLNCDDTYAIAQSFLQIQLILTDGTIRPLMDRLNPPKPGEFRSGLESVQVGDTYIYPGSYQPQGKAIGKLTVNLIRGKLLNPNLLWVPLDDTIEDDPEVRALLGKYYEQIGKSTPSTAQMRRLSWEKLEADPNNGYVGSSACRDCHQTQYSQWKTTGHSMAFTTLVGQQDHYKSECLSCHTTGFAYPSGFDKTRMLTSLQGVGCESCHGPAKLHAAAPRKDNIRKAVSKQHCADCHIAEWTPDFDRRFAEMYPKANHTGSPLPPPAEPAR